MHCSTIRYAVALALNAVKIVKLFKNVRTVLVEIDLIDKRVPMQEKTCLCCGIRLCP